MSVRVSCPYCNTGFTLSAVPPSGRATCPRCGDAFVVRGRAEEHDPGAGDEQPAGQPPSATPPATPRTPDSLRRAVLIGLAMGLVGLGIGAGVYHFRGDPQPPPAPEPGPSATTTPPPALGGLAFLPSRSNVVFAVQPGPVLAYAGRTNQDPHHLLTRAGLPASVLATLARAGVTLQQIDHVAGGAVVPDAADIGQVRLAVALVLRTPLADEGRFLEQLKAKPVGPGGKERYEVEFAGLPLKLAKASPTVWVLGWADEDLEPAFSGPPQTRLPNELLETISQKLPPDAAAWLATADEAWGDKRSVERLLTFTGRAEWLGLLKRGRAVVVGLSYADPPRLRVFVRAADAATAAAVREYFAREATAPGATSGGAGEEAMYDAPVGPAGGAGVLMGFIEAARE